MLRRLRLLYQVYTEAIKGETVLPTVLYKFRWKSFQIIIFFFSIEKRWLEVGT